MHTLLTASQIPARSCTKIFSISGILRNIAGMIGIAIAVRGQLCETKQLPANFIHATCTDIAEIKISPVTVGTNALLSTAASRITNVL